MEIIAQHPEPAPARRRLAAQRGRAWRRSRRCCSRSTSGTRCGPACGSRRSRSLMTMRLYDTARRAVVPFEPPHDRAHVRVRDHAVRLDAPRPRRDVPHLRPPRSAGSRSSATRCAWCATSPTSTTRSCPRRASSASRTSSSPKPRWRASTATWPRSRCARRSPSRARPSRSTAIIELVGRLLDSGHAYLTARHRVLRRVDVPRLRQALALPRGPDGAARARARRQPRRSAPARAARLRAVAAVARRRARVARAVRRRPARLAHRVLGDGDARARPDARSARRRHRPHLPAPRVRDRAERGAHRRAVRPALAALGDGQLRGREDVEVARQPRVRQRPAEGRPTRARSGSR